VKELRLCDRSRRLVYGVGLGSVDWTTAGSINDNCIVGNVEWGIEIYPGAPLGVLDLENNWYGAADGPGGIGPGSGDTVDAVPAEVDYDPWAVTSLPRCTPPQLPDIGVLGGIALALGLLGVLAVVLTRVFRTRPVA